jgi:hypothetical protein
MADTKRKIEIQVDVKTGMGAGDAASEALEDLAKKAKLAGDAMENLAKKAQVAGKSSKKAGKEVGDAMDNIAKKAKAAEDRIAALREKGDSLQEFGEGLAVLGGGPLALFAAGAASFVENAGRADAVSAEWLDHMDDIGRANMMLGREFTRAINPQLEIAAGLMGDIAEFARDNPAVVSGVVNIAGAIAAAGTLVAGIGTAMKFLAAAQSAGAAIGVSGAGVGAAATAAAPVAVAGTGVGAGFWANDWIAENTRANEMLKPLSDKLQEATGGWLGLQFETDAFSKIAVLATRGAGQLTDALGLTEDATDSWTKSALSAFGYLEPTAEAAAGSVSGLNNELSGLANSPAMGQAVDAFIAFQNQNAAAETQYQKNRQNIIEQSAGQLAQAETNHEKQRNQIVNSYGQQRAQAEANYSKQQADAAENFAEAEADAAESYGKSRADIIRQADKDTADSAKQYASDREDLLKDIQKTDAESERDYYAGRAEIIKEANDEAQRLEEEHQKNIRRMTEDHEWRLEDLIRNQDAIGFLAEKRNFERERQRAEEDHAEELRGQDGAIADKIADLEAGYAEEKAARQADNAERLAELDARFAEEKAKRETDKAERLAELDAGYAEDKARRAADYAEQQAEAAANFAESQAQAETQQAQKLAEADAAFAEEQARIASQEENALADLDAQYQEEKAMRDMAFADQIRMLDESLLGETGRKAEFYQQSAEQLQAWLDDMSGRVGSLNAGYNPNAPGATSQLATGTGGGSAAGGALGAAQAAANALTFSQTNNFPQATSPELANMVKTETARQLYQYAGGR